MDKSRLIQLVLEERGVHVVEKAGNQKVHCPFHGQDRNASASVHYEKGLFHCFTCEVQGDAIDLLESEGMNYADAVSVCQALLDKHGGDVPRPTGRQRTVVSGGSRPGRRGHDKWVPSWRRP